MAEHELVAAKKGQLLTNLQKKHILWLLLCVQWVIYDIKMSQRLTSNPSSWKTVTRAPSQYKDRLSRYPIAIIKIRLSWDRLIFIMGSLLYTGKTGFLCWVIAAYDLATKGTRPSAAMYWLKWLTKSRKITWVFMHEETSFHASLDRFLRQKFGNDRHTEPGILQTYL